MGTEKSFFVYGTLKDSECRGDVFKQVLGHDVERYKACIKAELYDLGSYPGICKGDDLIYGEVVVLSEEDYYKMLPVLDMIEGYEEDSDHNLYNREEVVVVCLIEGVFEATTYFFADKEELEQHGDRLKGGIWSTQKENILGGNTI